jgi:hypothetical protein
MKGLSRVIAFAAALCLLSCAPAYSQQGGTTGSLEITVNPKIGTQAVGFKGKRFYLLQGGLEANRTLIETLKTASPTSRDCFYCKIQASSEFIAWLKAGDCDSPYCREITVEDIAKVPEFKAAYEKSLAEYGNKPSIAQKWLINNLAPTLSVGFYDTRRSFLDTLLKTVKTTGSAVTDSSNFRAMFVNIPLKEAETAETFLVSNLVPIEWGGKSYTWACEVAVGGDEIAALKLQVPEVDKPVKGCEVIVRELPACSSEICVRR